MKTRIAILGAALVLLLASCFSPLSSDGGTGSITISVPSLEQAGISSSELTASAADDDNYFARAFIYRDGSEAGFGEVNVSSNEPTDLTIAGIPEGSGYSLVVTVGTKASGALFPETYGESEGTFSISGGQNTGISVAMEDSPFFYVKDTNEQALNGLKGVAVDSDTAFVTASSSAIYTIPGSAVPNDGSSFVTLTAAQQAQVDFTINGLNQGVDLVGNDLAWAAGPASRIIPVDWTGSAIVNAINALDLDTSLVPSDYDANKSILSSIGYFDTTSGSAVAMFQLDGGLGGGRVGLSGAEWGDTGEDLKDIVSGQPVLTIDVWDSPSGKRALFATKIGAFAVTEAIFDGDGDVSQAEVTQAFLSGQPADGLTPITLIQGGESRRITSMTAGSVGGKGRVFLGTGRGVFMTTGAQLAGDGEINADAGEATIVSGTQGLRVMDLALSEAGGYLVALTRTRLVVRDFSSGRTESIPNVAGVPGIPAVGRSVSGVKGMALGDANSTVYLGLAGDFGFAGLDMGELF